MRPSAIRKSPAELRVPPNLADYDAERTRFSWSSARAELAECPGGGLNIAYNAVTRHAEGPGRDRVAFRFLAGDDARELTFGALDSFSNRFANVLAGLAPEVDVDGLVDTRPLRRQVDLDSLDWLRFLVGLHERLQVDIPEADYPQLASLADLMGYLRARI